MKIGIDCGHTMAGADYGAVGIRAESNLTREVGTRVISKLQALGHTVIKCYKDTCSSLNDSLSYRTNTANNNNVDLYVSIHFNCFNGSAHGTEVLTYGGNKFSEATSVLNNIVSLGYTNRGVKDGSGLYVLRHTKAKAMLIECCFCDNAEDMRKFNAEKLADAIVKGLVGKTVSSSTTSKTVRKEDVKVKNIVVFNEGLDKYAAEYLGDYLNCSTISNSRPFDFKCVENVFGVGYDKKKYTSYLDVLITGEKAWNTFERVIGYILTKRGIKWVLSKYSLTEKEKQAKNKIVVYNNFVDKRSAEYLAYKLNCPLEENKNVDVTKYDFVYIVGGGDVPKGDNVRNVKGEDRFLTAKEVVDFMKVL